MPITETAAALIGAGLSAAGSVATTSYNAAQTRKQREWSEKMTAQANEWNLQQWNRVNEYNTPSAQVERLREAGLNPLYYGLDGSSANGLESAQALPYERANIPNLYNPFSEGLASAASVAQIENVQADTAKKRNENLTETQRREKLLADIQTTKQELENLKAQAGLTDAQCREIDKRIEWTDRLNEATISEKDSSAKLNDAQKKRIEELLEGEKVLQSKTIEDFDRRWSKIRAEIDKMSKESDILAKDLENYALNHANNGFMGTGLSLNNLFRLRRANNGSTPQWSDNDSNPLDLARSGQ